MRTSPTCGLACTTSTAASSPRSWGGASPTACSWPSGSRGSPRSLTPSPTARRSNGSPQSRSRCAAAVVRVLHAELERIANHLDSTIRHTEAAGQAVAYARLILHKERVQRLRAALCGSRFGRGVIVPGGVSGPLRLDLRSSSRAIDEIERALRADLRLLMATPSFLDRLRGTGVFRPHWPTRSPSSDRWHVLGPDGRRSLLPPLRRLSGSSATAPRARTRGTRSLASGCVTTRSVDRSTSSARPSTGCRLKMAPSGPIDSVR